MEDGRPLFAVPLARTQTVVGGLSSSILHPSSFIVRLPSSVLRLRSSVSYRLITGRNMRRPMLSVSRSSCTTW